MSVRKRGALVREVTDRPRVCSRLPQTRAIDYLDRQQALAGKWWIDSAERLCMVNETMGAGLDCTCLYVLGGQYYPATSNTREAPISDSHCY